MLLLKHFIPDGLEHSARQGPSSTVLAQDHCYSDQCLDTRCQRRASRTPASYLKVIGRLSLLLHSPLDTIAVHELLPIIQSQVRHFVRLLNMMLRVLTCSWDSRLLEPELLCQLFSVGSLRASTNEQRTGDLDSASNCTQVLA